ncbi:MAG: RNA polymerase sigma factor RpoD/SigA [Bacteroidales bacterium]|nr:RNA polymerase sigma factor RpoD/SigA [Bacteroidales bacterium]
MRQLKISRQVTSRDTQSLDKYLQEISKIEMVTPEEEVLLAQRIKDGDMVALEKLTKANLRFVISVSKQYQNQGLSLQDLINEGNVGLIKAAYRFDEKRGFKFISYAVWWIRQCILQALADQSRIVRLPLNKIGNISKINKAYAKLEQEFEREPNADEISEILNIPENVVADFIKYTHRHISMDAPLSSSDDDNSMYDVLRSEDENFNPEKDLYFESLSKEINRAINTLSLREREILIYYYGLNGQLQLTLEEIGDKLDLTRERVRQLKEKAVKKLKQAARNKNLKSYLG